MDRRPPPRNLRPAAGPAASDTNTKSWRSVEREMVQPESGSPGRGILKQPFATTVSAQVSLKTLLSSDRTFFSAVQLAVRSSYSELDPGASDRECSGTIQTPQKHSFAEEASTSLEESEFGDKSLEVTSIKEHGNALYSKGEYQAAVESYSLALEKDPANVVCLCNRAACFIMLGEHERASRDCLKAIEFNPQFTRAYIRCAKAYLLQGYGPKAKLYYEEAIRRIHDGSGDLSWIGECREGSQIATALFDSLHSARKLIDSRIPIQAMIFIDKALSIAPHARDPNLLKLEALIDTDQPNRAVSLMKELAPGLFEAPINSVPLEGLEPKLWRMPEKERRIDVKLILFYVKALMVLGDFIQAERVLQNIPIGLKHSSTAENTLERIRQMRENKEKGNAAYKSSSYLRAVGFYTEAIAASDDCCKDFLAIIYCNRAASYIALGKYVEAIDDCNEALKRKPNMEKVLIRKAKAQGYNRQPKECITTWKLLTELNPRNEEYKEELRKANDYLVQSYALPLLLLFLFCVSPPPSEPKKEFGSDNKFNFKTKFNFRSQNEFYKNRFRSDFKPNRPHFEFPRFPFREDDEQRSSSERYSTPRADKKDLFRVLGVSRTTSKAELKKQYHAMALKYHPDKNPDPDAAEKFREVTQAYQILLDDAKKQRYLMTGCF